MSVVFYYDIVCPFAYCASHLVEKMARRAGAQLHWRPVLLGGLYANTRAPQGKEGSATDVMAPAKLRLVNDDLYRTLHRHGVPATPPYSHPQRTVTAMRVLAALKDDKLRVTLSKAFFNAYWQEGRNMEEVSVLQAVADSCGSGVHVEKYADTSSGSSQLRINTQEASDRGAFGVPSFYIADQLFWGVDRMFMVERMLGVKEANQERLIPPPYRAGTAGLLSFYFDYSSPWSYLASMRLKEVIEEVRPVQVKVEYVPILVGALFKKIGIPIVPMKSITEAKQLYLHHDLQRWAQLAGVKLHWPDFFPLNSVLPLRVTLAAECCTGLISSLYKAVWRDNQNIGSPEVLRAVLEEGGFPAEELLAKASSKQIKQKLFTNTERAEESGLCGVPSFQVNDGPVVWGQDRLNVVQDMLCGWQQPDLSSKL